MNEKFQTHFSSLSFVCRVVVSFREVWVILPRKYVTNPDGERFVRDMQRTATTNIRTRLNKEKLSNKKFTYDTEKIRMPDREYIAGYQEDYLLFDEFLVLDPVQAPISVFVCLEEVLFKLF